MSEFAAVSASSYDPAALAATLTEKSAEGWTVVSIVPTGGDITAFLSRPATGDTAVTPEAVAAPAEAPAAPAPAVEPAGWAVAPEPAAPMAPIAESTPAYQPAPTYTPAPAPAYTPAPAPAYNPAAPTTPAVAAGWYADPAGRFELRYWDGSTWTEHVSRAGQQFTDPPVA